MVFKLKRPEIGDMRTKINYCIIPRLFKSDTHYVWLWLHRLEIEQKYIRYYLGADETKDKWETISESYNN